jgi:hypothetical protein
MLVSNLNNHIKDYIFKLLFKKVKVQDPMSKKTYFLTSYFLVYRQC